MNHMRRKVVVLHCYIHCHALASKTLRSRLKGVMDTVVRAVYFIRSRSLNYRYLKSFVRKWEQITMCSFFTLKFPGYPEVKTRFEDRGFILSLAYLADIFSLWNELNTSLRGSRVIVMPKRRYQLSSESWSYGGNDWPKRVTQIFPHWSLVKFNEEEDTPDWLQGEILHHLRKLWKPFAEHFDPLEALQVDQRIRNSFSFDFDGWLV